MLTDRLTWLRCTHASDITLKICWGIRRTMVARDQVAAASQQFLAFLKTGDEDDSLLLTEMSKLRADESPFPRPRLFQRWSTMYPARSAPCPACLHTVTFCASTMQCIIRNVGKGLTGGFFEGHCHVTARHTLDPKALPRGFMMIAMIFSGSQAWPLLKLERWSCCVTGVGSGAGRRRNASLNQWFTQSPSTGRAPRPISPGNPT